MNNYEDYREVYELYNDMESPQQQNVESQYPIVVNSNFIDQEDQISRKNLIILHILWAICLILGIVGEILNCNDKDCVNRLLFISIIITSLILIVMIIIISNCYYIN